MTILDKATAAELTSHVAPDLPRAVARLLAFCDGQDRPIDRAAIYYADVRAVLNALAVLQGMAPPYQTGGSTVADSDGTDGA